MAAGERVERERQNIQEAFPNQLRREWTRVAMYLSSGARLSGHSKSFDKCAPALESEQREQVIFKHAIATMTVGRSGGVGGQE